MGGGNQKDTNELKLALARIKALGEGNMNNYQKALLKWHRNVDKRYAWVVLLALFLMMSATLGPYRIYSLVYAKVTSEGVYTREEASWPVSAIFTVENLIGPLVSVVSYHLSYHQSMFIGGLLLTLGNGLCYFSSSLWLDVLLLGGVQGVGYAFVFMPFMEIVNNYFLKYRNSALGIALCGGTISIFGWSPLFQMLLEKFPWRYAYLGTGAVCCINLLMVPLLKPNPMPQPDDSGKQQVGGSVGPPPDRKLSRISMRALTYQNSMRRQSTILIARGNVQRQASIISVNPFASSAGLERKISRVFNDSRSPQVQEYQEQQQPSSGQLPSKNQSVMSRQFSNNSLAPSITEQQQQQQETLSIGEVGLANENEFDVSLIWTVLKTPGFHLIWYSELLYFWIFSIYCLVVVDYAVDRECTTEEAEGMLNYQSIGELVGRLLLTVLVDMRFLSNKNVVILVLLVLAGLLFLVTQVTGVLWMASITVATSAFLSLLYILLNGLLVDYLGERQVTLGYGMASCIGGLLMSFRPQAVGYFRDELGSYDPLMWCLGGSCLLGALLWLLVPLMMRAFGQRAKTDAEQSPI